MLNNWKNINNQYETTSSAIAYIKGGPFAPNLKGTVTFTDVPDGTMICAMISGLPSYKPGTEKNTPVGPHGFHIHENGTCSVGDLDNPFQSAGGHYNPDNQPHGNHAGDLPVLFSNNGEAKTCVFTNKFKVDDIINKTVIIHNNPDDFRSQPSGNAGKRLACGIIQKNFRY